MKSRFDTWAKTVRDVLASLHAIDYRAGGHDRSRFTSHVENYGDVIIVVWRIKWWNVAVITQAGTISRYRWQYDDVFALWLWGWRDQ